MDTDQPTILRYTVRVSPEDYAPYAHEYAVLLLAETLCMEITGSRNLYNNLNVAMLKARQEARRIDAQQSPLPALDADVFTKARIFG